MVVGEGGEGAPHSGGGQAVWDHGPGVALEDGLDGGANPGTGKDVPAVGLCGSAWGACDAYGAAEYLEYDDVCCGSPGGV